MNFKSGVKGRGVIDGERRWLWWGDMPRMHSWGTWGTCPTLL